MDLIIDYPKKAINKLSIPIIISLLLITVNTFIDNVWVSGLGTDVLAAMGKGVTSMCLIIIKESIFTLCSYSFAFFLGMGSYGIY